MSRRLDLHALLVGILGNEKRVYFQPPPSVKMTYPCIVYSRDFATTVFAGDKPYLHTRRYQVIIIDQDPDSLIPAKIAALPLCVFDRFYTTENLNHDVFKLFF